MKYSKKFIIIMIALLVLNYSFPFAVLAQESQAEADDSITIVESGDINADSEIINQVNTSETGDQSDDEEQGLLVENESESDLSNAVTGTATTGENIINNEDGDSQIVSGNIELGNQVENQANISQTDTGCGDSCQTATSGEEMDIELNDDTASSSQDGGIASTTINNKNNATTTNEIDLSAGSGENTIEGGDDAYIESGDIGIINIIANYINNNFIGTGKQFFINIFDKVAGSLDFSGSGTEPSSSGDCAGNCDLSANNDNNSDLNNSIVIDANTGENLISSSSGQALIHTGDIDIVNDILNIANLNVTGDDWFFAVVNIFGELTGDIILPPMDEASSSEEIEADTVQKAGEQASSTKKEIIVANQNAANVVNDIVVNAETGSSTIASSSDALVSSGDVEINLNIFNLVNYNITGNSWKFARVNVFGNWEGFIQGLPDAYTYMEDESGITIYNRFLDDFSVSRDDYRLLQVGNNNEATTTNIIRINANTGENSIIGSMSLSTIETGDINITNNLLNFINSNFSGDNWAFSMVNVFGNWMGNLSFGQPDLWIAESINKTSAGPGDVVKYTFLFGNKGDATAHNARISDNFNSGYINIMDSNYESLEGGTVIWDLGDIPPNTQGSISYLVQVKENIPVGESKALNSALISTSDNERDYSNNESGGELGLFKSASQSSGAGISFSSSGNSSASHPNFSIIKTNNADGELKAGDLVDFKITIVNIGNADAYEVLVLDVLKNQESGETISTKIWDLETVQDREEIIIEYSVEITDELESGVYNNEVMIEGWDNADQGFISAVASSKIKVDKGVQVLGLSAEPTLSAEKKWDDRVLYPGDEIIYHLVVRNDGEITAYDVQIDEELPLELSFSEYGTSKQKFYLGDIEPNMEKSIMIKAIVKDDAEPGRYESNTRVSSYNSENIFLVNNLTIDRFLAQESVALEVTNEDSERNTEAAVLSATGISYVEIMYLLLILTGIGGLYRRLRSKLVLLKKTGQLKLL